MTQAFVSVGKDHYDAPVVNICADEDGRRTPRAPSSPNVTRKSMVEVPRTARSAGRSAQVQLSMKDARIISPVAEHKLTVQEMVVWFSRDHQALKLPQLDKVGTENDGNRYGNRNNNSSESHPHIEHRSRKLADTIQAKPGDTTADGVKVTQNLMATNHLQLPKLQDHDFGAPAAKREVQQVEVEVKLCCQHSTGLHGGNQQQTNSLIETARPAMKHARDTDICQTVEYHENIIGMHQKFEDMSSHLRKTRIDLTSFKDIVSNCARRRCRCWWCRAYTGMQNSYSRLRSIFAKAHLTGNQVRPEKRNRVGLRRRSFNLKVSCVHVSCEPSGSLSKSVDAYIS